MKNRMMTMVVIAIVLAAAVVMMSCGGEKYADVKKLMAEGIAANDAFLKAINAAADGKAAAAALTAYAQSMKTLSPQIEGLDKKYPELGKNPPKELEELSTKFEKSSMDTLQAIMTKMSAFAGDPEVAKAMEAFETGK
ncbi:MAG: hypothetical protein EHM28_09885 [Spirochaetaceae bacterium]|nr:MAG: hypothetical protein EHM28_09885 [Spirochaetaceae bacterium]